MPTRQRVVPEQTRLDIDAGEKIAVGRGTRHLVGQARTDRNALEGLALPLLLAEAPPVLRLISTYLLTASMVASRLSSSFDGVISSVNAE